MKGFDFKEINVEISGIKTQKIDARSSSDIMEGKDNYIDGRKYRDAFVTISLSSFGNVEDISEEDIINEILSKMGSTINLKD